jgi:hypothetical protein
VALIASIFLRGFEGKRDAALVLKGDALSLHASRIASTARTMAS